MRIVFFCLILGLSAAAAQARDCEVPGLGRGGDWVKIQELERAFRCIIEELEKIRKHQRGIDDLETDVEALLQRVPTEYVNDNGRITVDEGRRIGAASFILGASRSGNPSALAMDQSVVEALCARRGCDMVLSLRLRGVLSSEPVETTVLGPCNFSYDIETGIWRRGLGCTGAAAAGTDGNVSAASDKTGADVILQAAEGCLFTDAPVRTTVGNPGTAFGRDGARGVFLVAAPDRRPDLSRTFDCVLDLYKTGIF